MAIPVSGYIQSGVAVQTTPTHATGASNRVPRVTSGSNLTGAAALSQISAKFTNQARGVNDALGNVNNGIAMTQVADNALGKVQEDVKKLQDLTKQASKSDLTTDQRADLQKQADKLTEKINKTIGDTSYDGTKVLSTKQKVAVQTGTGANDQTSVQLNDFSKTFGKVDLSSADAAKKSQAALDTGNTQVTQARTDLSKVEAQMTKGADKLTTQSRNLTNAQNIMQGSDMGMQAASQIGSALGSQSGNSLAGLLSSMNSLNSSRLMALLNG